MTGTFVMALLDEASWAEARHSRIASLTCLVIVKLVFLVGPQ